MTRIPTTPPLMSIAIVCAAAVAGVSAACAVATPARAETIVTAESRFGNGVVSGPVRIGRFGREVRLPGGTWEPCKRSCSETLRVNTVDFWYANGPNATAGECGLFGCLTLRYPR